MAEEHSPTYKRNKTAKCNFCLDCGNLNICTTDVHLIWKTKRLLKSFLYSATNSRPFISSRQILVGIYNPFLLEMSSLLNSKFEPISMTRPLPASATKIEPSRSTAKYVGFISCATPGPFSAPKDRITFPSEVVSQIL